MSRPTFTQMPSPPDIRDPNAPPLAYPRTPAGSERLPDFLYPLIDWLNRIDDRQPARAARGELGTHPSKERGR